MQPYAFSRRSAAVACSTGGKAAPRVDGPLPAVADVVAPRPIEPPIDITTQSLPSPQPQQPQSQLDVSPMAPLVFRRFVVDDNNLPPTSPLRFASNNNTALRSLPLRFGPSDDVPPPAESLHLGPTIEAQPGSEPSIEAQSGSAAPSALAAERGAIDDAAMVDFPDWDLLGEEEEEEED